MSLVFPNHKVQSFTEQTNERTPFHIHVTNTHVTHTNTRESSCIHNLLWNTVLLGKSSSSSTGANRSTSVRREDIQRFSLAHLSQSVPDIIIPRRFYKTHSSALDSCRFSTFNKNYIRQTLTTHPNQAQHVASDNILRLNVHFYLYRLSPFFLFSGQFYFYEAMPTVKFHWSKSCIQRGQI